LTTNTQSITSYQIHYLIILVFLTLTCIEPTKATQVNISILKTFTQHTIYASYHNFHLKYNHMTLHIKNMYTKSHLMQKKKKSILITPYGQPLVIRKTH
jgi:hypothetical protein